MFLCKIKLSSRLDDHKLGFWVGRDVQNISKNCAKWGTLFYCVTVPFTSKYRASLALAQTAVFSQSNDQAPPTHISKTPSRVWAVSVENLSCQGFLETAWYMRKLRPGVWKPETLLRFLYSGGPVDPFCLAPFFTPISCYYWSGLFLLCFTSMGLCARQRAQRWFKHDLMESCG